MSASAYGMLADVVLGVHCAFAAFVVVGFALILAGFARGWHWVHHRAFRAAHLVAVGIVVVQAWLGRLCPLTVWESNLRRLAGQPVYTETFVQHWLGRVLFYDAEPWVFTAIYTLFGALVAIAWWAGRVRRRRDRSI